VSDGQALGPGREFDLVRGFVARWGALAAGIGGDCAELDVPFGSRLVVSTDASVEGVHFRRGWLEPREIGWRAAAAAMSDLAAAAAEPLGLLLALTLPPGWRADADAIADGVGDLARASGARILGGDVTGGGELALGVTVLGHAPRPLRRDGARAGDLLWVTGRLGGPGAALRALLADERPEPAHQARFARPVPRLREARWLHAHGATAGLDVSDGLAADARHLAAASRVHLHLDVAAVPRVRGVAAADALRSGEEYELLVTAPRGLDRAAFEREFGIALTPVGEVRAEGGAGVSAVFDLPDGHDHLSR
jgi:thiamine-monophosphate kinase